MLWGTQSSKVAKRLAYIYIYIYIYMSSLLLVKLLTAYVVTMFPPGATKGELIMQGKGEVRRPFWPPEPKRFQISMINWC